MPFRAVPGTLEFLSYCINFQTVLVGPPLTFRDYLIYIEGREHERLKNESEKAYLVRASSLQGRHISNRAEVFYANLSWGLERGSLKEPIRRECFLDKLFFKFTSGEDGVVASTCGVG